MGKFVEWMIKKEYAIHSGESYDYVKDEIIIFIELIISDEFGNQTKTKYTKQMLIGYMIEYLLEVKYTYYRLFPNTVNEKIMSLNTIDGMYDYLVDRIEENEND